MWHRKKKVEREINYVKKRIKVEAFPRVLRNQAEYFCGLKYLADGAEG
jgi:hypothetical protein